MRTYNVNDRKSKTTKNFVTFRGLITYQCNMILYKLVSKNVRPKKINVLFPETSEYFLGLVGRQIFYFKIIFYIRKA